MANRCRCPTSSRATGSASRRRPSRAGARLGATSAASRSGSTARCHAGTGTPASPLWNDSAARVRKPTVSLRIRLHTELAPCAKKAVLDKLFDEGHCEAVLGVVLDVSDFTPWLTTSLAVV